MMYKCLHAVILLLQKHGKTKSSTVSHVLFKDFVNTASKMGPNRLSDEDKKSLLLNFRHFTSNLLCWQ